MTRKLIIFFLIFLTSNSIYTMDMALCLIPNALELLQCVDRTIPEVCTLSVKGISIYEATPIVFALIFGSSAYKIYQIIKYPTQELQRFSRRSDILTIVPFILGRGGNPYELLQSTGCAAIHRAAHIANLTLLKMYLAHKKQSDDIDIQNHFGETSLILTSCSNNKDTASCIKLLTGHGACLQSTNFRGLSPLHFAVYNQSEEALQELLNLGADVRAIDFKGNTPLHYAARASFSRGIELLLQYRAVPDERNHEQKTALECIPSIPAERRELSSDEIRCEELRSAELQRQVILFKDNPCLKCVLPKGTNMVNKLLFLELGLQ